MVLLKSADERGFTFFSGYESRKGRELAENPRAALLFHRAGLQVRVEGRVERIADAESDAYWESRPAAPRRSAAAAHPARADAARPGRRAGRAAPAAETPPAP